MKNKMIIVLFIAIAAALVMAGCSNMIMDLTGGEGAGGEGAGGGAGYNDTHNLSIGDEGPGGGMVFYINPNADADGWKYLEVMQSNLEQPNNQPAPGFPEYMVWSDVFDQLVGGTSTDIGTGMANTNAIIAQDGHEYSAAQVAREYRAGEEGDWYLPSRDELQLVYDNLHDTSPQLLNLTGGQFWTSSEVSATQVYAINPSFGNQVQHNKNYSMEAMLARAIRAF
ncbi:DUF1566 domain-containing protein [Spirochaeta africana]|uniref:DUF1566 domain-containing protein n=1 Tax=Spirochaeta africana (strain ATCC 700263 / DSM 8902 / Z-7692) TaxID=889378 RepID=H9UH38_SPIAZ|nr:DUF1566 domain-containing protein [Spirochaeta africana]AFG36831.1 hypothetical protein Spiaf_0733 [Spirochaeta africana DSM 8902]